MHVSDPSHTAATDPTVVSAPEVGARPSVPAPPAAAAATPPVYEQCDECGAPADTHQRYCVMCGAHRRHVDDPAARYLSQATAGARGARVSARTVSKRPAPTRGRGLGAALALAVIPVAAAVGVAVGRSSNNDDGRLIQALARRPAAAVTTAPTATAPAAGTATTAQASTTPARAGHKRRKTPTSTRHKVAKATSTPYGTVTQIAGSKPTTAQVQQGGQDTQKVQKSTGKTYVNQQSNLPGTVVVP